MPLYKVTPTFAVNQSTPGTNLRLIWSAPEALVLTGGNVGASQPITTNIFEYSNPFPYAWLYDIVVYARSVTGTGVSIDVYNQVVGGKSYLNSPILLPASTVPQTISARVAGNYNIINDLTLIENNMLGQWSQNYNYPLGQIFSLRASTPASGAITNLQVTAIIIPTNDPTVVG